MELVAPLIGFDWTFVMVLVTFFVLYLIVKKFFFEKIHDFMQAREQKVIDQFDNAAEAERQAEAHLAEYTDKLEGIEVERRGIVKDARSLAEKRAEQIIFEAHEEAARIIKQAENEIERERAVFADSMRDQVAMLAVYAAEKIIEKELDEKDQLSLIDGIIGQDGGEAWRH
ncbi:MAG: F0F1 ATP synthase subunit B [Clostridiales bacterium]|nr:F0F1 ATP synthase subunit B [Clostridiales bacterium]